MIGLLEPEWPAPANIRAFTTLRTGPGKSAAPFDAFNLGLRNGDEVAAVQANRADLHAMIGSVQAPRWLRQVHGAQVLRMDSDAAPGQEPTADAAVTDRAGLPLAILTADCLPVLFCAADGSEVGAAHAGWQGLAAGVLEATVAALHTPSSRLLAWIGPCAGPTAYEIGAEVQAALLAGDPGGSAAFTPTRPGHWLVDLPGLARRRLAAVGVQRVFGGDECTISDPARYYSHRRDHVSGRMASVILIESTPRP